MALFMDLVALSNGLHGSVQMDSVALFSWIGWLRHHGIFTTGGYSKRSKSIVYFVVNRYQVNRMKEQVHEIDSGAYIIMSEVADIFSNNMDKV